MCRFKAQIADNSYSVTSSCNDEAMHFSPKIQVCEQIADCLVFLSNCRVGGHRNRQ